MPKPDLSNAMKSMGARANQRLQLDEPAPAPAALMTVPPPTHDSESDPESELDAASAPSGVQEPHPVSLSAMVPSAEPKRRGKKTHDLAQLTPAKHMGTIEMPYVRQRDNTPTRKVSAILPVDLARELQVHCVLTGQRTNTFIEEALRVALAQAKSRRTGR